MKSSSLSLDIETLVELTPEETTKVNGGLIASSVMPTPTAVSSAKPPAPVHHHKHHRKHHQHHTVSSAKPPMMTPPVHI